MYGHATACCATPIGDSCLLPCIPRRGHQSLVSRREKLARGSWPAWVGRRERTGPGRKCTGLPGESSWPLGVPGLDPASLVGARPPTLSVCQAAPETSSGRPAGPSASDGASASAAATPCSAAAPNSSCCSAPLALREAAGCKAACSAGLAGGCWDGLCGAGTDCCPACRSNGNLADGVACGSWQGLPGG